MVRELFVMAREHAPSIIFMDEIDSIGSSRLEGGSGGDSEVQRTMLELLNQLDGFEATKNIKVSDRATLVGEGSSQHLCHCVILDKLLPLAALQLPSLCQGQVKASISLSSSH